MPTKPPAGQRLHAALAPGQVRFDEFAQALSERIPALKGAELVAEGRPGERVPPSRRAPSPMGRNFPHLSRRRLRLSRRPRRILPGEPLACRRPRRARHRQPQRRARLGPLRRRRPLRPRLTASFARVVAVESAPSATQALAANLKGTTGAAVRAEPSTFSAAAARAGPFNPPRSDRCGPAAHRPRPGDHRAARRDRRARAGLRLLRPATLARDLRALIASGYADRIHHPRRPLSPDLPSGDSGPVAPLLIGLTPIGSFPTFRRDANRIHHLRADHLDRVPQDASLHHLANLA
jgi:hypothetical protein